MKYVVIQEVDLNHGQIGKIENFEPLTHVEVSVRLQ